MNTLTLSTRAEWRTWLKENHAVQREIWLIFFKKHTGQPGLSYTDAVEEALCFGWIDSLARRIDEDRYAQKMTPRTNLQNWSETNKRRVAKLFRAGLMTPPGLAKCNFNPEQVDLEEPSKAEPDPELPEPLLQVLMSNPQAWENFNHLAPSHRRQYVGWITQAKKDATRLRRLEEAISLLEQNKKLETKWFNRA